MNEYGALEEYMVSYSIRNFDTSLNIKGQLAKYLGVSQLFSIFQVTPVVPVH